jgi:hypothetical protein
MNEMEVAKLCGTCDKRIYNLSWKTEEKAQVLIEGEE